MAKLRIKRQDSSSGTPEYMLTYGDMMSLLLCLFIMITAMSEVKKNDKFHQAMLSIRSAFGASGELRAVPSEQSEPTSLLQKLQNIVVSPRPEQGDADDPGVQGRAFRVTNLREGIHIELGGRIAFDRFSARLKPEAEALVAQVATMTAGHNTILEVTGHATREPLPSDSACADAWDLSYARARAVGNVLIANEVRPARIRLKAAGAEAPVRHQAYDEDARAQNRRVEIVVTEQTVEDYSGTSATVETQETTDAGSR